MKNKTKPRRKRAAAVQRGEHPHGDCLAAVFNLCWRMHRAGKDVLLVHGHVSGRGELTGTRFAHAWVEELVRFQDFGFILVHDHSNGRQVVLPRELYYNAGQVCDEPGQLYRYTFDEAKQRLLENDTYLFWELPLSEDGL